MTMTIRASLSGYNSLTEANIDNYSLYADSDNILIKEKTRGSVEVGANDSENIAHGLAYVPFVLVFAEVSSGKWIYAVGEPSHSTYIVHTEIDTTNVTLVNDTGSAMDFKYYIFYDQQV